MKEISVEKTLTVRKYEAVDGTLFDDKDECQRYENTARCVLLSKYNKLIIKKPIYQSSLKINYFNCFHHLPSHHQTLQNWLFHKLFHHHQNLHL